MEGVGDSKYILIHVLLTVDCLSGSDHHLVGVGSE